MGLSDSRLTYNKCDPTENLVSFLLLHVKLQMDTKTINKGKDYKLQTNLGFPLVYPFTSFFPWMAILVAFAARYNFPFLDASVSNSGIPFQRFGSDRAHYSRVHCDLDLFPLFFAPQH